jgi:cation diffusion facilitator CzcD-associated flavoprotein CzcO
MHFKHKAVEARWNQSTSKWHVKVENLDTNEIIEDVADVFMTGSGFLNEWKWPDIPGLHSFKGHLLHSANWDDSFDATDKTIAVLGAGSSGIQIVPTLLPTVKKMHHYVRGRTWISATFGNDLVRERNDGQDGNFTYTDEEKARFQSDPEAYVQYRMALEVGMQGGYAVTHRDSKEHVGARAAFDKDMRRRLAKKPEIAEHLLPDFPPLCKRLTPGPGYLEALCDEKCEVIPVGIERVDEKGVIAKDGKHRAVDAIVCATGFDTSFQGRIPIIGRNGTNLQDRYQGRPETYLSVAVDEFPNFFQSLGPNAGLGNGNLLIIIEAISHYVGQILQKLATGNVATVEPKREVVKNFTDYCDAYFKRTVFSAECGSWYKSSPPGASPEERKKGRVTALWPGSSIHAVRALEKVRWEDYVIKEVDGNPFGWFGDGWTVAERTGDVEGLSWYLNGTKFLHKSLEEEKDREGGIFGGNMANGLSKEELKKEVVVPNGVAAT